MDELLPGRGVAAMVDGRQVAVFRVPGEGGDEYVAVANRDPFSGANVIARGIVGSVGERTTVASPMFKQRFDLRTGACLDVEDVTLETWPVALEGGWVAVLV